MTHVRSWAFRAIALPTVFLLGAATTGCPGSVSNQPTGNSGGGGNGGDGGAATGGTAGAGGEACQPAVEICDMKDNDCNGAVDDIANPPPGGCLCNDGDKQACYSGEVGTLGIGACAGGEQTCANGTWGACAGEVIPTPEACNGADDDCNGLADDLGMTTCGVGACAVTVDKCVNGQPQSCVPNEPTQEICDGLDNNCNQLLDESDPMLNTGCETGTPGVCSAGKMKCLMAALVCAADVMATPETCDGLDNNCDGLVDNDVPQTGGMCDTGAQGVCNAGTISCQLSGGVYQIDCFSNIAQSDEICDGLDNDCDGTPDDNNPEGGGACDTGNLGICAPGTLNCVDGTVQCVANALSSVETCNGVDDNCDGQIDEGNPGGGLACGCAGAGTTACQNAAVVCNGGPITYFTDDFHDNSNGWVLDPTWQIGSATAGSSDPGLDHTATADNGVAGVVLGGIAPIGGPYPQPRRHITSPNINLAAAGGAVYLQFWRWLNSDYPNYMDSFIEVSANGGATWTKLWGMVSGGTIADTSWKNIANPAPAGQYPTQFDITAFKSATTKVRFGWVANQSGVFSVGSWNIDDVTIASAVCP